MPTKPHSALRSPIITSRRDALNSLCKNALLFNTVGILYNTTAMASWDFSGTPGTPRGHVVREQNHNNKSPVKPINYRHRHRHSRRAIASQYTFSSRTLIVRACVCTYSAEACLAYNISISERPGKQSVLMAKRNNHRVQYQQYHPRCGTFPLQRLVL